MTSDMRLVRNNKFDLYLHWIISVIQKVPCKIEGSEKPLCITLTGTCIAQVPLKEVTGFLYLLNILTLILTGASFYHYRQKSGEPTDYTAQSYHHPMAGATNH